MTVFNDKTLATLAKQIEMISKQTEAIANLNEIITNQTNWEQKTVIETLWEDVWVQNPFQVDWDSIYTKDIDVANSDNWNFSWIITDYVDSLKTVNSDATANNPKIIKFWFNRSIYSHGIWFWCDDLLKSFWPSITIKLLWSWETIRYTKTFLTTDPNSFVAEFWPKVFNWIILEFNTALEVCLSNITIAKSLETNSTLHWSDPDWDIKEVQVTTDWNLSISDNSSWLAIAEWKVSWKTFIHKFGTAPLFNKNDWFITIWDWAEDWEIYEAMSMTYSLTNDIDFIVCDEIWFTEPMEIQGLDINYELIIQTINLNGQTPVPLTTNLRRVFRMKNVWTVDVNNNAFIYASALTAVVWWIPTSWAWVRAVIHADNNQTEMATYTVPAWKTWYVRDWYASTAWAKKDSSHTIKLFARPFGQVFQLKHTANMSSASWAIQHKYVEPEKFTEKTDIEMKTDTDQDGTSVSWGFDIVLVDNV